MTPRTLSSVSICACVTPPMSLREREGEREKREKDKREKEEGYRKIKKLHKNEKRDI